MFRRLGYFRMSCRSLENRFAHLSCRPPLASCRSLCSTAIALLLVILVRSLRHQGWRDLRWLDRGALLHGGGTFPFDRQWGRSYFHAISQEPLLQKAVFSEPGTRTHHVPWERVNESASVLRSMGAEVTLRRYPGLGHTINRDEIEEAKRILQTLGAVS
jgi:hypothetical protein